jgi:uncharacterized zinc-type alcohol dehydrogenase-like protein
MGVHPMIPGHEIIGRIYAVGKNVTNVKEGDLVGVGPIRDCCENCEYCISGEDNMCSETKYRLTIDPWFAGFATSVQIPSVYVFKVPEGVKEEEAPPLMCAGCTVYAPLKKWGKIGGKVAILGIGGLGHLAVQMARKMGMKTYAVSTSNAKKDAITKLGANVYINSSDPEQMSRFYSEKIDLILNTTSSGDIQTYMRALRKGSGVFVQIGGPEEAVKINPIEILLNQWIYVGSAAASRTDTKNMLNFCETNSVQSVNEHFTFEDFPKAYERINKGKPEFRVVVDVKNYKFDKK